MKIKECEGSVTVWTTNMGKAERASSPIDALPQTACLLAQMPHVKMKNNLFQRAHPATDGFMCVCFFFLSSGSRPS